jgi:hypothetical protein
MPIKIEKEENRTREEKEARKAEEKRRQEEEQRIAEEKRLQKIINKISNSTVIIDKNHKEFIVKNIMETMDYRRFIANLLYRGSRDGWSHNDFHRLCDNKGALLVLIKASNGRLCGGFSSISW